MTTAMRRKEDLEEQKEAMLPTLRSKLLAPTDVEEANDRLRRFLLWQALNGVAVKTARARGPVSFNLVRPSAKLVEYMISRPPKLAKLCIRIDSDVFRARVAGKRKKVTSTLH